MNKKPSYDKSLNAAKVIHQWFLVSMMVLLILGFASHIQARPLPDNLDYQKYQNIYEKQKSISDSLRNETNEARRKLAAKKRKINRTETLLRKYENDIYSLRNTIDRLRNKNSRLKLQINRLENDINQSEKDLMQLEKRSEDKKKKKQELTQKINQKNEEFSAINNQIDTLLPRFNSLRTRLNQAQNNLNSAKQNLQEANSKFSDIERNISDLELKINQKSSKINNLTAQRDSSENEATRDELTLKIERLQTKKNKLEQNLSSKIRKREQIQANQSKARGKQSVAEQNLSEAQTKFNKVELKMNKLTAKQANISKNLSHFKSKRQEVVQQIQLLKENISDQRILKDSLRANIQEAREQISQNKYKISELKRNIDGRKDKISYLNKLLLELYKDREHLQNTFQVRNQNALRAESETQYKLEQMLVVKANFDQAVAKAQDEGKRQGSASGKEEGIFHGSLDGAKSGRTEGSQKGKENGLLDGYNRGKIDGYADGKNKGYEQGLNLPSNYNSGFSEGLKRGKQEAFEEARAVDYPKGFGEKSKELSVVHHIIDADNGTAPRSMLSPSQLVIPFNNSEFSTQVFTTPYQDLNTLSTLSDNLITFSVEDAEAICRKISSAEIPLKELKYGKPQCSSFVYTVIINKCDASYLKSWRNFYLKNYISEFRAKTYESCLAPYRSSFSKYKNSRYKEGYKETYKKAFDKWFNVGVEETRNRGFKDGRAESWNKHISRFRNEQYLQGKAEAIELFKNNPVIKLLDSGFDKLTEGRKDQLVAGDSFNLKLNIANFGSHDALAKATKVKFIPVADKNLKILNANKWIDLVKIPRKTRVNISNVAAGRIEKTAQAKNYPVKVVLGLSAGKQETYNLNIRVVPNVTLDLSGKSFNYGHFRPFVGSKYNKLRIKFKNTSNIQPDEDLKLTVRISNALKEWKIKFKKSTGTIAANRLAPGKKASASTIIFKIGHWKALRKKLKFSVTVTYKGNISYKGSFVAIPERYTVDR